MRASLTTQPGWSLVGAQAAPPFTTSTAPTTSSKNAYSWSRATWTSRSLPTCSTNQKPPTTRGAITPLAPSTTPLRLDLLPDLWGKFQPFPLAKFRNFGIFKCVYFSEKLLSLIFIFFLNREIRHKQRRNAGNKGNKGVRTKHLLICYL